MAQARVTRAGRLSYNAGCAAAQDQPRVGEGAYDGNVRAIGGLLAVLLAADATPPDEARPLRPAALRTAAERGDAEAQYQVALAFLARGGRAGEREALRWLKAAARQRHAGAEARLARLYTDGLAVRTDPRAAAVLVPESTRLLQDAAAQGEPEALLGLAEAREAGRGVSRDPDEALRLLRAAAEKGQPEAAFRLARLYRAGTRVPRDEAEE
jgi:hypothetical protein